MVDLCLNPWDMAATRLLVPEAGGRCVMLPPRAGKGGLVFGAPALVEQLLGFLSSRLTAATGARPATRAGAARAGDTRCRRSAARRAAAARPRSPRPAAAAPRPRGPGIRKPCGMSVSLKIESLRPLPAVTTIVAGTNVTRVPIFVVSTWTTSRSSTKPSAVSRLAASPDSSSADSAATPAACADSAADSAAPVARLAASCTLSAASSASGRRGRCLRRLGGPLGGLAAEERAGAERRRGARARARFAAWQPSRAVVAKGHAILKRPSFTDRPSAGRPRTP